MWEIKVIDLWNSWTASQNAMITFLTTDFILSNYQCKQSFSKMTIFPCRTKQCYNIQTNKTRKDVSQKSVYRSYIQYNICKISGGHAIFIDFYYEYLTWQIYIIYIVSDDTNLKIKIKIVGKWKRGLCPDKPEYLRTC